MFSINWKAVSTQRLQNLLTRLISTVSVDRVGDENLDGNFVVNSSNGLNKRTRVYRYLSNNLEKSVFFRKGLSYRQFRICF